MDFDFEKKAQHASIWLCALCHWSRSLFCAQIHYLDCSNLKTCNPKLSGLISTNLWGINACHVLLKTFFMCVFIIVILDSFGRYLLYWRSFLSFHVFFDCFFDDTACCFIVVSLIYCWKWNEMIGVLGHDSAQ